MIPKVSEEIITSIREQSKRTSGQKINDQYFMEKLKEIKNENPNLADAMIITTNSMQEKFDLSLEVTVNILNLGVSVYEAIKQQIICEELK